MKARVWSVLLAPLLGSCALEFPEQGVRRVEVSVAAADEPATVPVVIFADELHTGLVLELAWLERHGYVLPDGVERRRHVAFSWGDETAYVQERWLSPGQVVHALFLPSRSVMEVIPFEWHVPEVCPTQRLYQAFVPESAGGELARFINGATVMDEAGRPVVVARSSWGEGVMVRSPHAYYFPRICNIWTVEALNAAGFKFHGLTGLSADGVVRQARRGRNGFQKIWDPRWQDGGFEPRS